MVSGGSGSGKSEFAENLAVRLASRNHAGNKELIYIATMMAYDNEARKKVERHRYMRRDKNFITIECYTNLSGLKINSGSIVLLDCMSNLAANEMFNSDGAGKDTIKHIINGVDSILSMCGQEGSLIIVTNEVFSDGCIYDKITMEYIRQLGEINRAMADRAGFVVEVIYGIPVYYKKQEELLATHHLEAAGFCS